MCNLTLGSWLRTERISLTIGKVWKNLANMFKKYFVIGILSYLLCNRVQYGLDSLGVKHWHLVGTIKLPGTMEGLTFQSVEPTLSSFNHIIIPKFESTWETSLTTCPTIHTDFLFLPQLLCWKWVNIWSGRVLNPAGGQIESENVIFFSFASEQNVFHNIKQVL